MFGGLSHQSFVFWPVGCGDCTTVVINDSVVMQIDLNDGAIAEADDNERIPVVDELVAKLPEKNGRPYLSCLALTHPDWDHCKGYRDLAKRVTIGELWHTPRVFREFHKDMSDDAKAFRKEAKRRVAATIAAGGDPGAGNRVRIIGYDQLLQEDDYRGFPRTFFTRPGSSIGLLDGQNWTGTFSAFVHAPFVDDSAGQRNETSLAMQVELVAGQRAMRGLFLGDLSYPTLRRIVDETRRHQNDDKLVWNALLAPHHCSKKAMYEKDLDGHDVRKQDILDDLEAAQAVGAFIIASSPPIPGSNSHGDNPPHAKARSRYEEIVSGQFLCTGEYSTADNMRPIILANTPSGVVLASGPFELSEEARADIAAVVARARGVTAPPAAKVGFGGA
jgi:beta-lactamase superfamily II metal-dependent hydrolase